MIDRRRFLERMGWTGGALLLAGAPGWGCAPSEQGRQNGGGANPDPLRILILGGTGFIGPHQVEYALSRGHTLTLFNRGRTNTHIFPEVERLVGDRNGDLTALEGRDWDAVLDNSGYEPAQVRATAQLLAPRTRRYLFVSTQSVYASRRIVDQDESGAIGTEGVPREQWDGYGPLKAHCEITAREILGDRLTVVRPAVIVGPGDRSDRFTYWVLRVDRGGEVMAPGDPGDPVQFIDVRDVTGFMVRLVEQDQPGTYNATGPADPLTFAGMLDAMKSVSGSDAEFTWVDPAFMEEQGVRAFADMPMWMPPTGPTAGFMRMSAARAMAAGLTYRPLDQTVAETLAWCRTEPPERWEQMRAGITPDREAELLRSWHLSRA
jgi:2'-hydroxyisoflavone reductase